LSVLAILERHEQFAHFGAARLAALADSVEMRQVESGSLIVHQGEEGRDAFLLERGGIRIQRATPYGQFALRVLGRGDLFGEPSFIDGAARSSDAYSTSRCELLAFRADSLLPRLEADPLLATALYWAFWRSLSAKLRRTNEKIGRFLADSASPPAEPPSEARPSTGEFHIDLRIKRDLFTEQRLSPLEINLLASLSREKRFRPGARIFREGDPGDAMYIVLEGRVRISKQIPGVGEEALGILERGDYFGEMALIDHQPRSADARAHDPDGAVVLAIPKDVVDNLLDIRKVSAVGLLALLCKLAAKRLRDVDEKLVTWYILAGGNAPEIR